MAMLSNWFTTAQAGRELGVTPAYIRLLCRQGRLPHETTPYGRLIDPAAVAAFAVQRAKGGIGIAQKQGEDDSANGARK